MGSFNKGLEMVHFPPGVGIHMAATLFSHDGLVLFSRDVLSFCLYIPPWLLSIAKQNVQLPSLPQPGASRLHGDPPPPFSTSCNVPLDLWTLLVAGSPDAGLVLRQHVVLLLLRVLALPTPGPQH